MKQTKIYKFFDQVRQEAKKVVWPERKELVTSVVVVIIAVFLFDNIINYFLRISATETASEAMFCKSLGIMILVACPSATLAKAS